MPRYFFGLLLSLSVALTTGCGGAGETAGPGSTPEEEQAFAEDYQKQMEQEMMKQGGMPGTKATAAPAETDDAAKENAN